MHIFARLLSNHEAEIQLDFQVQWQPCSYIWQTAAVQFQLKLSVVLQNHSQCAFRGIYMKLQCINIDSKR